MVPRDHAKRVARKLIEAKGRGEQLRAVQEASRQLVLALKREAIEEALALVVRRVLGARWERRRGGTPWSCRVCGPRVASQVRRNGHYRRFLVVGEGTVQIRVPQVECVGCGRSVSVSGGILEPRSRYWIELDQKVTEWYLSGCSHRKVVEILARRMGTSLSPMTSWRALQRVAEKVKGEGPRQPVRVVGLDEIVHRVGGQRRYSLGAQDAESGEWLAMRVSRHRGEEAWVKVLDELWEKGISPDSGVEAVVSDGDRAIEGAVEIAYPGVRVQRCHWHLLRNVGEVLERRYPGKRGQEQRRRVMEMVRGILTASTEEVAKERWRALTLKEPHLTRYLLPQMEKALAYRDGALPRTSARMERAIREYRRRTRPMDGFKTDQGAENFNRLWMAKERARKRGQDWLEEVFR